MPRSWFMVLLLLTNLSYAAKILLIPFHHGAHIIEFAIIGQTLKHRGHVVYEIVADKYSNLVTDRGIDALQPNITHQLSISERMIKDGSINSMFSTLPKVAAMCNQHVSEIMEDSVLMKKLAEKQFDLVSIDGFDMNRAAYIIPYKLSLRYISLSPRPDPWVVRVPAFPSVEGMHPIVLLTEESNIFHRLLNGISYLMAYLFLVELSPFHDDSLLTKFVPEKENIGILGLYKASQMFLVQSNIYCLDELRVSAPHYQYIPSIGGTEPKPLPMEISEIFNKSQHGVIVLTFGSAFRDIPHEMMMKMLTVFRKVKYDVILRHTGAKPDSLPSNMHIMQWLPQNDILRHPMTKLFITHVGLNGLLEAIYHGVPMLMMPLSSDQFGNAQKAEAKGYGIILDSNLFTPKDLEEAINNLMENPTFRNNIKNCSAITKSLPAGHDTVAFWVEHILRFGGSHLKPYYLDTPLWKFLMVDVFLVVCIVCIVLVWGCKLCFGLCCRKVPHQKTE